MKWLWRFGLPVAAWLLPGAGLAPAQQPSQIPAVTVASPKAGEVKVGAPKVSAVTASKVDVAAPKMGALKVADVKSDGPKAPAPQVSKVTVGGSSEPGGGKDPLATLDDQERQLVEDASKDDLNWKSQVADGDARQQNNAESVAQSDAVNKTVKAAEAQGLDRSEVQKLANAARERVNQGPAAAAPAATPAVAEPAQALPEILEDPAAPAAADADQLSETTAPDADASAPTGASVVVRSPQRAAEAEPAP